MPLWLALVPARSSGGSVGIHVARRSKGRGSVVNRGGRPRRIARVQRGSLGWRTEVLVTDERRRRPVISRLRRPRRRGKRRCLGRTVARRWWRRLTERRWRVRLLRRWTGSETRWRTAERWANRRTVRIQAVRRSESVAIVGRSRRRCWRRRSGLVPRPAPLTRRRPRRRAIARRAPSYRRKRRQSTRPRWRWWGSRLRARRARTSSTSRRGGQRCPARQAELAGRLVGGGAPGALDHRETPARSIAAILTGSKRSWHRFSAARRRNR